MPIFASTPVTPRTLFKKSEGVSDPTPHPPGGHGLKGDGGFLEADGGHLTRGEGSIYNLISSHIKIIFKLGKDL